MKPPLRQRGAAVLGAWVAIQLIALAVTLWWIQSLCGG
jgi:hypothetical protein